MSSSLNEILEYLQKTKNILAYNKDLQKELNSKENIKEIYKKLLKIDENNEIIAKHQDNQYESLIFNFLAYMNNLINDCDDNQIKNIYYEYFFIENINSFKSIIMAYIKSLKVQKAILGIIYILQFTCNKNLSLMTKEIIYFLFDILDNVNIQDKSNHSNDVSDWVHILMNIFIQNKDDFSYFNGEYFLINTIFSLFNNQIHICNNKIKDYSLLFLEFIRDTIEIQKESKELELSEHFVYKTIDIIKENIHICYEYMLNIEENFMVNDIFFLHTEDENTYKKSSLFKKLLLLSDIFAVIITYEPFVLKISQIGKSELKNKLQSKELTYEIMSKIIYILQMSDKYYEKYNHLKGEKQEEAENIKISVDNIFYSFQTNIFKLISNFSYKNNSVKEYFLNKKEEFYYLLNHLKNDKCNPFKREWSVLFIKAVSEECQDIQNMINDLKPNEIDPFLKDYLLKRGYDISIDKGFSKPKIVKREE